MWMESRVSFRPLRPDDLDGDTSWSRMPPEQLRLRSRCAAADPFQRVYVALNEAGRRIGRIEYVDHCPASKTVCCNIYLGEEFVGRGYGTELMPRFCLYLFDLLDVSEVKCLVGVSNLRAIRCLSNAGFTTARSAHGQCHLTLNRAGLTAARFSVGGTDPCA